MQSTGHRHDRPNSHRKRPARCSVYEFGSACSLSSFGGRSSLGDALVVGDRRSVFARRRAERLPIRPSSTSATTSQEIGYRTAWRPPGLCGPVRTPPRPHGGAAHPNTSSAFHDHNLPSAACRQWNGTASNPAAHLFRWQVTVVKPFADAVIVAFPLLPGLDTATAELLMVWLAGIVRLPE